MKRTCTYIACFLILTAFACITAGADSVITSSSTIDWTTNTFASTVLFDTETAGISLPSGKNTAMNKITRSLPKLIKDPLLTIPVDSARLLGDMVLDETVTLEQLTEIIDSGRRSPPIMPDGTLTIKTTHSINLLDISTQMIRHNHSYEPKEPIDTVASRPYTGIIIDARGALEVQGEFITDTAKPCFFPKIWDSDMNLIYERNMMDSAKAKKQSIIVYDYSDNETRYKDRVGTDPMRIIANKIYGQNRTDPVISRQDALRILSVPENRRLFESGKVVILLNKEQLVYKVQIPVKDNAYYVALNTIVNFPPWPAFKDFQGEDAPDGIHMRFNLKFVADSAQLLPEETERIASIATMLKQALDQTDFTFLVEGHTADVGKPEGEMLLSVQRAQAVIEALIKNGVPKSVFTYQGFGGTKPEQSNATAEGRAQNRRVVIRARPKGTYIGNY